MATKPMARRLWALPDEALAVVGEDQGGEAFSPRNPSPACVPPQRGSEVGTTHEKKGNASSFLELEPRPPRGHHHPPQAGDLSIPGSLGGGE